VEPLWGNPNSVLWGKAGDRRGSAKTRFAGRHRRPPILHYRTRQHPGYIGLRRGSARAAVLKHYHSMHSPIACWIRTRRSDLECASYRFFVATGARIAAAPVAHCPPLPIGPLVSELIPGHTSSNAVWGVCPRQPSTCGRMRTRRFLEKWANQVIYRIPTCLVDPHRI